MIIREKASCYVFHELKCHPTNFTDRVTIEPSKSITVKWKFELSLRNSDWPFLWAQNLNKKKLLYITKLKLNPKFQIPNWQSSNWRISWNSTFNSFNYVKFVLVLNFLFKDKYWVLYSWVQFASFTS